MYIWFLKWDFISSDWKTFYNRLSTWFWNPGYQLNFLPEFHFYCRLKFIVRCLVFNFLENKEVKRSPSFLNGYPERRNGSYRSLDSRTTFNLVSSPFSRTREFSEGNYLSYNRPCICKTLLSSGFLLYRSSYN